jgi:hypothetical protein
MQYVLSVILGVLAAIGALTLIAVMYVMRFGDNAFAKLRGA